MNNTDFAPQTRRFVPTGNRHAAESVTSANVYGALAGPPRFIAASQVAATGQSSGSRVLQRKADNKYVREDGLLSLEGLVLQRKLTIGASNDPLEQEADRVAAQVLAMPSNASVNPAKSQIQRFTGHLTGSPATAPASVDYVIASPGNPLEPVLRKDMEQRFGHDFSRLRIHSGGAREQSARDVNANAYTVGHNIVFGAGQFAPESRAGRGLIAHELKHVMQQSDLGGIRGGKSDLKRNPSQISTGTEHLMREPYNPAQGPGASTFALRRQTVAEVKGWAGATGVNKGETTLSGIRRIPLDGLSVGHARGSRRGGRAIALLPSGLDPTKPVDVLVHFHGRNAGYQETGRTARDISIDNVEGQLADSGRKQMLGILPQGDANSSFGENSSLGKNPSDQKFFDSDSFIGAVLGTLIKLDAIKQLPKIGQIMISGHSGAGELINEKLLKGASGSRLPKTLGTLREVALFDAVNGPKEYEALKGFLRTQLQQELVELIKLPDDSARSDYLKNSFRFRAYFSYPSSDPTFYSKWHVGPVPEDKALTDKVALDQVLANFFSQQAGLHLGEGSTALSLFRNNYQIIDAGKGEKHEKMVAEDHLKDAIKVLPQLESEARGVPSLAPPSVHVALRSSHRPLEGPDRAWAEKRFQRNLGAVQIHDNAIAKKSAVDVQARAFTVGQHVVFGDGQYAPGTSTGRSLLAHELVHVIQQNALERPLLFIPEKLPVGTPNDICEDEAKRVEEHQDLSSQEMAIGSVQRRLLRPDEEESDGKDKFYDQTFFVSGDTIQVAFNKATEFKEFHKSFAVFVPTAARESDKNNIHLFFTPDYYPMDFTLMQGLRAQMKDSPWILIAIPALGENDNPRELTISTAEIKNCLQKANRDTNIDAIRLSAHSRGVRSLEATIGGQKPTGHPTIDLGIIDRISVFDASHGELRQALASHEKEFSKITDDQGKFSKKDGKLTGIRLYDVREKNETKMTPWVDLFSDAYRISLLGLFYVRFAMEALEQKVITYLAGLNFALTASVLEAYDEVAQKMPARGSFSAEKLKEFLLSHKKNLIRLGMSQDLKSYLEKRLGPHRMPDMSLGVHQHHWIVSELAHEAVE